MRCSSWPTRCCVPKARSARWRADLARLRNLVAAQRLLRATDDRIVPAVDVSPWRRPDANTSPERSFCHTYGRDKRPAPDDPRLALLDRGRAEDRPHCWTRSGCAHADRYPRLKDQGVTANRWPG
ncbi:transposase [Lentzea sp. NPDC051208]|uniref:transposase n=1 Tax=Lentzea sp. NPDC051208 TaxID=3154642 RepID=UPI0034380ADF